MVIGRRRGLMGCALFLACSGSDEGPSPVDDTFSSGLPTTTGTEEGEASGSASAGESQSTDDGAEGDPTGDGDGSTTNPTATSTSMTGDGDGTATGDGDGTATGDGDGTATSVTGDGDGTATSLTGDGDGTTTGVTGDGDGTATGDGDGTTTATTGPTTGDGDGTTGDGDGTMCEAPATHVPCDTLGTAPTPLQAVGLNCPGNPWDSTPTVADSFTSPDAAAWRIARQWGTSGTWTSREGDQMLLVATGQMNPPDAAGTINMGSGYYPSGLGAGSDDNNVDTGTLPAPINPVNGGSAPFMGCDGVNDCSNSLQGQWIQGFGYAYDMLWFDMTVDVPAGTNGWTMDFNFFTAEYPMWVASEYNDIFVAWSSSTSYVGNVCFVGQQPCTVTALAGAIQDTANGGTLPGTADMAGTGMTASDGAATGWYQMSGSATPGESLELTFAVFDMGDAIWDTIVLLDNWQWDCQGCDPTIPDDCGVTPVPQ